jgi:hypothetical protein
LRRSPRRDRFARSGSGAHDRGLDHDVGRAANHQQMFDIVAADQQQTPTSVNGR